MAFVHTLALKKLKYSQIFIIFQDILRMKKKQLTNLFSIYKILKQQEV